MDKVLEYLKTNLAKNTTIVVAVSGGPDSMCLLSLVNSLKEELNLKVIVAHVNHKLRLEADEEEEFVRNYALKNNLIFQCTQLNEYKEEKFSEADGRKRRYSFFDEVMKKYQANYLLTAHHGDDLVETILMRLTRGSNLNGYIGIKRKNKKNNYIIYRPLLEVTKDDILNYLKENNIDYKIDKSNEDTTYTRNRYRKNILPLLKEENKNVHLKYLKFSKELEETDNFINEYINKNMFIIGNAIIVNKLKNESNFIKRKCLETLVKDIQLYDYFDISDYQIKELMKLYNKDNISINLNNSYVGINNYGHIKIIKNIEETPLKEQIIDKDITYGGYKFKYNNVEYDNSNSCICLDSSEIELPLILRPYQNSDKIQVKNLNGHKKISDILIDLKIPRQERKNIIILTDSKNELLWVPNLKKSQFAKDKLQKYDIIIKCEGKVDKNK